MVRNSGIEITGPLTSTQKQFAVSVAKQTGLSPKVIAAQVLAEMSGGAAAQRDAEGYYNWLNIGHTDGGELSLTQDPGWRNNKQAARLTADFIKGKRFGPGEGIQKIITTAGRPDSEQMAAITSSGWASSAYGGSLDTYGSVGVKPGNTQRARKGRKIAKQATQDLREMGIQIKPKPKATGAAPAKPTYVNFSKTGTKWLVGTSGNEVLKFQKPLATALIKLAKASGEPIQVNSGFRSNAEQAQLYQAYLNGTGNLAAPPGQSNHNRGAAADVQLTARQRQLAPQFGLGFPVGGEDWHIELVGNAASQIVGGSTGATSGGVFDFSAPSGSSSSPFDTKPLGNRQLTPAERRIKRRRNRVLNSSLPTSFDSTVPELSVSSSTVKAPVLDI